jgi:hypothetical protein
VHDNEDTCRDVRVSGVLRARGHIETVIIELEEVLVSSEFEVAEVVLVMRIFCKRRFQATALRS